MRTFVAAVLLLLACGAPSAAGRAGEPCAETADCREGLTCKGARGDLLCLPASWFAGGDGAYCYVDSDCSGAAFTCDTQRPPLPYVDGRCAKAGQNQ